MSKRSTVTRLRIAVGWGGHYDAVLLTYSWLAAGIPDIEVSDVNGELPELRYIGNHQVSASLSAFPTNAAGLDSSLRHCAVKSVWYTMIQPHQSLRRSPRRLYRIETDP